MDDLSVLQQRDELPEERLMSRGHNSHHNNACSSDGLCHIVRHQLRIAEATALIAVHVHLKTFNANTEFFNIGQCPFRKTGLIPYPHPRPSQGAVTGDRLPDAACPQNGNGLILQDADIHQYSS